MALLENIAFQIRDSAARAPVERSRGDCLACWFMRLLVVAFIIYGLLCLILGAFALWHFLPDAQAVLDFVAPTAAQSRGMGWVALSEGR